MSRDMCVWHFFQDNKRLPVFIDCSFSDKVANTENHRVVYIFLVESFDIWETSRSNHR